MADPEFRPVVVAPTYNNVATLGDILRRIAALGLPVIAVDDGSTDGTTELLANPGIPAATVVTHPRNRGKAAALRSGFAAAAAAGFTHAVTIDTDGQLDPEEIPALLDAARAAPHALIVGCRNETADDYPARSRLGRRASNLLVRLESGARVDDSQCGFRVYPLGLLRAVRCRAGRYGFETEIITRAAWAGCPIEHVTVTCRYLPPGQRVSHFRPFLDSLRSARMHVYLLGRAMLPLPRHPRWPGHNPVASSEAAPARSHWQRFRDWVNPARAWRDLRQSHVARAEIAAGLSFGVFIANLPVYGFQSILSLYAARRLHLNPLAVLLGSHISTPPIGPLMIAAAIGTGHLLLHGTLPVLADFDPRRAGWFAMLRPLLLEWSLGALIVGFVMSVASFFLALALMKPLAEDHPNRPGGARDLDGDAQDTPADSHHPAAAARDGAA
jgi:uncharacterized protein (DUF2062 family)